MVLDTIRTPRNPTADRFVAPTLAKNARMGQPQFEVIHGAEEKLFSLMRLNKTAKG
jgi:hypothetical protein